jgi:hypothetical protein
LALFGLGDVFSSGTTVADASVTDSLPAIFHGLNQLLSPAGEVWVNSFT